MNNVKINELRQWMAQHQVQLAYISDPGHIAYFSGYESDPHERVLALFIPLEQDPFLSLLLWKLKMLKTVVGRMMSVAI